MLFRSSGLVHISEVANAFVSNVSDHVQVGQTVKVMVLSVTPEGKTNLSIKRALAAEQPKGEPRVRRAEPRPAPFSEPAPGNVPPAAETSGNQAFEDRLKKFMQESDSRIADSRMYAEHKQRRRR